MSRPDASNRPNVILICVDQWRGDCLSIDGHPVVQTPFLDLLCTRATRFGRAYAAVPSCIAARASLHTGLTQHTHGRVGYRDGVNWNYPTTLAGEFTRHGYQTQGVGKMHFCPERERMGFDHIVLHSANSMRTRARAAGVDPRRIDDYLPWFEQQVGPGHDPADHGMGPNDYMAQPWSHHESTHYTNFTVTQSIDFLRRRDERRPFFLFMSFNAPHPPLDPPAWAFDYYNHMELPDPLMGDWADRHAEMASPFNPQLSVGPIAPGRLHRAMAGYYAHITHIDAQINRFMDALASYNLQKETYVCFVSDHGELMGDHNLFRKTLPFEGSARVPLLLTGPADGGIVPNRRDMEHVIELRDIMPTLLDCAGLTIPDSVEGQSFLPIARGEKVNWRPHLHGEHGGPGGSNQWLTDGHEKYIWFSADGSELLFNLDDDPDELHNLADKPRFAGRLDHWRKMLVKELAGREEGHSDGEKLIAGRPTAAMLSHIL